MIVKYHAGIVLKWHQNYLVVLRDYGHSTRCSWQFPQGRIEYNELPLEAAKRELMEETDIHPDQVIWMNKESSWLSYRSIYHVHKIKFFYGYMQIKPHIRVCIKEFSGYQWATMQEILQLFQHSFKEKILRAALMYQ